MRLGTSIFLLFLCALSFPSASASAGDANSWFQRCAARCARDGCVSGTDETFVNVAPECSTTCNGVYGPGLRWFGWDCQADCEYQCMQRLEVERSLRELPRLKYHGKWCFTRVCGMQEVVSVVTSLLNLAAHVRGGTRIAAAVRLSKAEYRYAWPWAFFVAANVNAWLWSAVFHARDVPLSERLDYTAAFTVIIAACAAAVARMWPLSSSPMMRRLLLRGLVGLWLYHGVTLVRGKVDYGWNMQLCLALGLSQSIAWIAWSQVTKHPARRTVLAFMLAVNCAVLFEILDFPAFWGLVDAHSLWHASTAIVTPMWYSFVVADVRWEGRG